MTWTELLNKYAPWIAGMLLLVPYSAHAGDTLELTLSEAIDVALRENLSIAEAGIAVQRAEAEVTALKGEFDPSVKFDINKTFTREQTISPLFSSEEDTYGYGFSLSGKAKTGTAYELKYFGSRTGFSEALFLEINPYYTSGLELVLSQPVLKGFGTTVQEARVDAARKGLAAARLGEELRAMEIIADTAGAYWDLFLARSNHKVARDSLTLAEKLLEEVRTKIKTGALAPVEIYKAEAEAAVRQERLLQAGKTVRDAEDVLRALMDSEDWGPEIVPVDTPPDPAEIPAVEEIIASALQHRRDYKQAITEYEGRKVMSLFYRNQKLPGLDLTASGGLSGLDEGFSDAFDDATSGDYYSWKVGMSLSIPLGNRAASGNYLRAKRDEDAARLKVEQTEKLIVVEVREAVRALELARESIKATGRTRVASHNRLKAEEERFRLGMATLNDVLRFQEEYAETLSAEARAHTDYARALVNVRRAGGVLSSSNVR